jgi:hypothetical protein
VPSSLSSRSLFWVRPLDPSRVGTHKQEANDHITTDIDADDTLSKQVRVAAGLSCASVATRIK